MLIEETGNGDTLVFADALRNTGRCYQRLKQYDRAQEMFQQSADVYLRLQGPDCVGRGISLVYLGDSLLSDGKLPDAEKRYRESLPIYERHFGKQSVELAWTRQRLDSIYRAMGDSEAAEREKQGLENRYRRR